MAVSTKDREIIITRIVNAPRTLVWKVWTEPDHLIKWWGPDGFTNTFYEFNFRVGGVWRFMMHGPDGTDYPNRIKFDEIVKHERIAYTHDEDKEDVKTQQCFHTIASFEDVKEANHGGLDRRGKTKVTLHMILRTKEECEAVKKFGAVEGGNQTLAKLAAYAESMR